MIFEIYEKKYVEKAYLKLNLEQSTITEKPRLSYSPNIRVFIGIP